MNLQENISRIKEVMGITLNENRNPIFLFGGLNWYKISSEAKNNVNYTIRNEFGKIPEINSFLWRLFPSIDSPFGKSLINDVKKGVLSSKTIVEFKNHMLNYLNDLSKDNQLIDSIRKKDPSNISKVKSPLAKPIIKIYVNKFFNSIIPSYFIGGMIDSIHELQKNSIVNQEISLNSEKVIKQLSSSILNDSQLKNTINSIVNTTITKL